MEYTDEIKKEIFEKYRTDLLDLRENIRLVQFNLNYAYSKNLNGLSIQEMNMFSEMCHNIIKIHTRLGQGISGEEDILSYERKRKINGIITDLDNG